ncbi:MAG: glycoside hydrolase family 27 protein [Lachnospiraceae bacterium]|nr:glycoside hydrolase family 27 protein [Lachnospiraceae bacterium]
MNKNLFAVTPPMGWNSYDYYDTTVNEAQVRANADYMAAHLKSCGWEYIVVDIEWYAHDAGSQRDRYQYIPFWPVEMDEYSRLLPDPVRFPSSVDGAGFKPLADYVHTKGLKFGIHIMRGIPREAAHKHTAILGSDMRANDVADPANTCFWNPDMYGVRPELSGSQAYYDSIMALYAEWGVDFIKCDDICRMDQVSARQEIVMLHDAIEKCGRPIVLSLSPGPARIEEAWHYEKYANMWRITDDFWDKWDLLLNMFERCELWEKHVGEGCWPDCDMLPLGKIGAAFGHEHDTGLTRPERITMLTLWSIFRSPMMLGCELTKLDDDTLSLITNADVMRLLPYSQGAHQIMRDKKQCIWKTHDTEEDACYIAMFNFADEAAVLKFEHECCGHGHGGSGCHGGNGRGPLGKPCKELWTGREYVTLEDAIKDPVDAHGARLYKIYR